MLSTTSQLGSGDIVAVSGDGPIVPLLASTNIHLYVLEFLSFSLCDINLAVEGTTIAFQNLASRSYSMLDKIPGGHASTRTEN